MKPEQVFSRIAGYLLDTGGPQFLRFKAAKLIGFYTMPRYTI